MSQAVDIGLGSEVADLINPIPARQARLLLVQGDIQAVHTLLAEAAARIVATRPTAVNLFWALERMKRVYPQTPGALEDVDEQHARERHRPGGLHHQLHPGPEEAHGFHDLALAHRHRTRIADGRRRHVQVRREEPTGDLDEVLADLPDPAKPVPYRARPIPPTWYPGGSGWSTWQLDDQRFVDGREVTRRDYEWMAKDRRA